MKDETEPWVLPHFNTCHGPCEQGRKPCPCPMACEEPSKDDGVDSLGLLMVGVVMLFAIIGVGAVIGFLWR